MNLNQAVTVRSKRTGEMKMAVPVVTGFTNKKADMFRLYNDNGSFSSVDWDSIRRRYEVVL